MFLIFYGMLYIDYSTETNLNVQGYIYEFRTFLLNHSDRPDKNNVNVNHVNVQKT